MAYGVHCPNRGSDVLIQEKRTSGSVVILVILLVIGILPGLVYLAYKLWQTEKCPLCGMPAELMHAARYRSGRGHPVRPSEEGVPSASGELSVCPYCGPVPYGNFCMRCGRRLDRRKVFEMQHIMTGKVKEVYAIDRDTLEFAYTDHISVFDKIIPSMIPHKGETLCRTAKYWFGLLTREGINNHFISEPSKDRMDVRRVQVIRDYSKIDGKTVNYLIPLEVICRHYAAGSLMDRVKKGRITAEMLGFPAGHEVRYGEKLPRPFLEVTTKLEETDRNLTYEEALDISGLSEREYGDMMDLTLRIDAIIDREASKRGLIHCDGKKEYGFDGDRRLMVLDTFGTLDEDRWWDADEYAKGNIVELSKEFVRQYYRDIGYHEKLYGARERGEPEPDIPALPQDVIDRVSRLYVDMYERITGEKFRDRGGAPCAVAL